MLLTSTASRRCGLVCLLVSASIFLPITTSKAHAEFSSTQLDAITQQAYRGSTWVRLCNVLCESLWNAESGGHSKQLTVEMQRLRQEVGILPTLSALRGRIYLTSYPKNVTFYIPGERPETVTINIPAQSDPSYFCGKELPCYQWLAGRKREAGIGYFNGDPGEDGLVWYWQQAYGGLSEGTLVPDGPDCLGFPEVPVGLRVIARSQSSWCKIGATQQVGFAGLGALLTSTPIRDTENQPTEYESFGPNADPGWEAVREEIEKDLTPEHYPFLLPWLEHVFNPCSESACTVPPCASLSAEACENLLEEEGFTDVEEEVLPDQSVDFGKPPGTVVLTEPPGGTKTDPHNPVKIKTNPPEGGWNEILMKRFRPVLVYAPGEAFHADSYKEMTDWHKNYLERNNGSAIYNEAYFGEHRIRNSLGSTYPDGNAATSDDRLISGGYNDETETAAEAASSIDLTMREENPQEYADKDYGQVVADPEADLTWVQYWFFYYHNPSPPGAAGFGEHQGDWEMAQFAFSGTPESGLKGSQPSVLGPGPDPGLVAAAEHRYGRVCPWEGITVNAAGVPVLYPALDSHATYFGAYPGEMAIDDSVTGEGEAVRPEVIPVSLSNGWLDWPGLWGETRPEYAANEGEEPSPHGPAFISEHPQWNDPSGWAAPLSAGGGCGV